MNDFTFMREALKEADKAFRKNEAPVGAVAVFQGKILARAHNMRECRNDPLGHAELIVLSKLCRRFKNWRALGVTIYVTLEPCLMCMGAFLQARVKKIVFGPMDPKGGACGSLYDLSQDPRLNHQIEVTRGVLKEDCADLLKKFFEKLRKKGE